MEAMVEAAAPTVDIKVEAGVNDEQIEMKSRPSKATVKDMKTPDPATEDDEKKFDAKAPKKYKAWDKDEMMLLRRGVQRHGVGNWEAIRQDPDFKLLQQRTGVQIKDKWRNLVKFRHLTEEEKQAIALRANKLNRRSAGRSNSFTFGPNATSSGQARPGSQDAGAAAGTPQYGQTGRYQGFSAYSRARDERMKAEAELSNAQSACEQASAILEESVVMAKQSSWDGDSAHMEGLLASANEAMRCFMLCKQRAQAARDLEANVMKSLHLEPGHTAPLDCQSMPSSPVGGRMQLSGQQKMRPNMALLYGRSQSYDPSSFSRLLDSDDRAGPAVHVENGSYSSFSDDGVGSGFPAAFGAGPTIPMIRTSPAKTRSPRRSAGSTQPGSPLGRMQRQGHGRNSPLARPAGLYGSCEQLPSSPMTQLSNQFDVQLGQDFMHGQEFTNGMGSCSRYEIGPSASHMADSGGAGDSSAGSATHMAHSTDDSNPMYYGIDTQSAYMGAGRGTADPGTSAFLSAGFSGISSQSGMNPTMHAGGMNQQAFGKSTVQTYGCVGRCFSKQVHSCCADAAGGGDMGSGLYRDMLGSVSTTASQHGGMNTIPGKTGAGDHSGWGMDLQMSEFASSYTNNHAMGQSCSDVFFDCMEDVLANDGLMGPIPSIE